MGKVVQLQGSDIEEFAREMIRLSKDPETKLTYVWAMFQYTTESGCVSFTEEVGELADDADDIIQMLGHLQVATHEFVQQLEPLILVIDDE